MTRWVPLALLGVLACTSRDVRLARPPQAFGGFDRTVPLGSEVALDASPSLDPDGDPLRYSWSLAATPEGSAARLDAPTRRLVRFIVDRPGTYVVALQVDDGLSTDTDLVGITAVANATTTEALSVVLPPVCHANLADLFSARCGLSDRRVEVTPSALVRPAGSAAELRWTFLRLPPGVTEAALEVEHPSGPVGELSFSPPRPGEYWIGVVLTDGRRSSPLVVATVAVWDDGIPPGRRPTPVLKGPARARPNERLLLDGRDSVVPTASVATRIDRSFALLGDPSGEAQLLDLATGCPPGQCRILSPPSRGRYLVGHSVSADGVEGGSNVWVVEVE